MTPFLRDKYLAGRTLTEEVHYFGFPRTGSHFFVHCLNGLFDLITFPHEHLDNPEAISRQTELNPEALYALDLREEGSVHQPLFLNASPAGGVHGRPFVSPKRAVILIRHPLPTLYSFYRVNRDRWGAGAVAPAAWLEERLSAYVDYYAAAWDVLAAAGERALLVRYEALTAGAEALEEVVRFVGLRPKLAPGFVHWVTRFERFARAETADAPRTFYRAADPHAYAADPAWRELAAGLDPARWERFGYGPTPTGATR